MIFVIAIKICCDVLLKSTSLVMVGVRWSWENLLKLCSAHELGLYGYRLLCPHYSCGRSRNLQTIHSCQSKIMKKTFLDGMRNGNHLSFSLL